MLLWSIAPVQYHRIGHSLRPGSSPSAAIAIGANQSAFLGQQIQHPAQKTARTIRAEVPDRDRTDSSSDGPVFAGFTCSPIRDERVGTIVATPQTGRGLPTARILPARAPPAAQFSA